MYNDEFKKALAETSQVRLDSKVEQLKGALKLDAQGVNFLTEKLSFIEQDIVRTIYRDEQEVLRAVPVKVGLSAGHTNYTFYTSDVTGQAAMMHPGVTERPLVSTHLAETSKPMVDYGAAYSFTVSDMERAQILRLDDVRDQARACASAIMRSINTYALTGDTTKGTTGLADDAGVTPETLAGGDLTADTAAVTFKDMQSLINSVAVNSEGAHRTNKVLMPMAVWTHLVTTPYENVSGATLMEKLRDVNPGVSFELVVALTGQGASSKDRVIAMEAKEENGCVVVPSLYEEAPVFNKGFLYLVDARGVTAGWVTKRSDSLSYGDFTV